MDIARRLPDVETDPAASRGEGNAKSWAGSSEWDQGAADVLDLLARADAPLSHTAIVRGLAGRGYGKAAAYKAIAGCQGRGWIEHDLTTGYVLSGATDVH